MSKPVNNKPDVKTLGRAMAIPLFAPGMAPPIMKKQAPPEVSPDGLGPQVTEQGSNPDNMNEESGGDENKNGHIIHFQQRRPTIKASRGHRTFKNLADLSPFAMDGLETGDQVGSTADNQDMKGTNFQPEGASTESIVTSEPLPLHDNNALEEADHDEKRDVTGQEGAGKADVTILDADQGQKHASIVPIDASLTENGVKTGQEIDLSEENRTTAVLGSGEGFTTKEPSGSAPATIAADSSSQSVDEAVVKPTNEQIGKGVVGGEGSVVVKSELEAVEPLQSQQEIHQPETLQRVEAPQPAQKIEEEVQPVEMTEAPQTVPVLEIGETDEKIDEKTQKSDGKVEKTDEKVEKIDEKPEKTDPISAPAPVLSTSAASNIVQTGGSSGITIVTSPESAPTSSSLSSESESGSGGTSISVGAGDSVGAGVGVGASAGAGAGAGADVGDRKDNKDIQQSTAETKTIEKTSSTDPNASRTSNTSNSSNSSKSSTVLSSGSAASSGATFTAWKTTDFGSSVTTSNQVTATTPTFKMPDWPADFGSGQTNGGGSIENSNGTRAFNNKNEKTVANAKKNVKNDPTSHVSLSLKTGAPQSRSLPLDSDDLDAVVGVGDGVGIGLEVGDGADDWFDAWDVASIATQDLGEAENGLSFTISFDDHDSKSDGVRVTLTMEELEGDGGDVEGERAVIISIDEEGKEGTEMVQK